MTVPISVRISTLDGDTPLSDHGAVLLGPVDRVAQLCKKSRASHLQEAQASPAGRELQVFVDAPAGMNNFQVLVNEDSRRCVIREKPAIKFLLCLRETGSAIREPGWYSERCAVSGLAGG